MRGIMVRVGAPHNRPADRADLVWNSVATGGSFPDLCATGGLRDFLKTGQRYLQTREEKGK
jgi:hypothetical protein